MTAARLARHTNGSYGHGGPTPDPCPLACRATAPTVAVGDEYSSRRSRAQAAPHEPERNPGPGTRDPGPGTRLYRLATTSVEAERQPGPFLLTGAVPVTTTLGGRLLRPAVLNATLRVTLCPGAISLERSRSTAPRLARTLELPTTAIRLDVIARNPAAARASVKLRAAAFPSDPIVPLPVFLAVMRRAHLPRPARMTFARTRSSRPQSRAGGAGSATAGCDGTLGVIGVAGTGGGGTTAGLQSRVCSTV